MLITMMTMISILILWKLRQNLQCESASPSGSEKEGSVTRVESGDRQLVDVVRVTCQCIVVSITFADELDVHNEYAPHCHITKD